MTTASRCGTSSSSHRPAWLRARIACPAVPEGDLACGRWYCRWASPSTASSRREGPESVVTGLDQPLAVLHHGQPGAPVLGDQLEPGLPAGASRAPPPLGDRPGPGPGRSEERRVG